MLDKFYASTQRSRAPRRRRRLLPPEELERRARGATDFPSYLSGLVPNAGHGRSPEQQRLIDRVLRDVCSAWYRVRGPVLP